MLDSPASAVAVEDKPPAIGEQWQGGTYIGHTLHENQLAHLIVLPEAFKGDWKAACEWAAKQDAVLPSRIDQLVMLPHRDLLKMERAWYWSGETHPEYSEYAWVQIFGNGIQYDFHKTVLTRARAVRRLVIK